MRFQFASLVIWVATASAQTPAAGSKTDQAIVLTDVGLSVTGLKQTYNNNEAIDIKVSVPRQNVLRARTEVVLMRDDIAGRPLYQDLRDYDRYTDVQRLHFTIKLPESDRHGQLALLVRVRGLRNRGEGTPAEAFEDALTYRIGFSKNLKGTLDKGTRLEGRIFFGFDAATLDEKSSAQVVKWAEALEAEDTMSEIRVEGHADQIGGSNYNLELSRRRAESVRTKLIEAGIKGHLIRVVGFGFKRPNVKRQTQSGRGVWENRRAEVVWFRGAPQ